MPHPFFGRRLWSAAVFTLTVAIPFTGLTSFSNPGGRRSPALPSAYAMAAAASLPGTIQAEDFDDGANGVAYRDNSAANSGGQYRTSDVDIEVTSDTNGGYDVGWTAAGE